MQYSESTLYGMNLLIKDYAHFPRFLPLPCHAEHGWVVSGCALPSDLAVNKPVMLVHSRRRQRIWQRQKTTPALVMGSLFIHYKNKHRLQKNRSAKGTIVFAGHSTEDIQRVFDIKEYCQQLKKLPPKFQPVTVCLFWTDYVKSAKIYRQSGLKVVTAGRRYKGGLSFVKNFYRILANHKYACSNEIGTHLFYSVDFGLPFFLYGERTHTIVKQRNLDQEVNLDSVVSKAYKMFDTGPISRILPEQKEFVKSEMGIGDCLTPQELHNELWRYFKKQPHKIKTIFGYWAVSVLLFLGGASFIQKVAASFQGKGGRK